MCLDLEYMGRRIFFRESKLHRLNQGRAKKSKEKHNRDNLISETFLEIDCEIDRFGKVPSPRLEETCFRLHSSSHESLSEFPLGLVIEYR